MFGRLDELSVDESLAKMIREWDVLTKCDCSDGRDFGDFDERLVGNDGDLDGQSNAYTGQGLISDPVPRR